MKLDKAIKLIKQFEGCELEAYRVGGTGAWTIGYGHTNKVQAGDVITQEQADAYLAEDVAIHASRVEKYQSIYNFNENQYNALVSFCYNVGNINGLTLNGTRTKEQILQHLGDFVYYNGRRLVGLEKRRFTEALLYNTPMEEAQTSCPYAIGKVYTLQANVIVRQAPYKTAKKVGYSNLTADGKKYDPDKNGSLNKGTQVTCKDVSIDSAGNTWIKCPSGWLAAIYDQEVLIK